MPAPDAPVLYEQDGGIVTVTLNAPKTRNALDDPVIDGIVEACRRINADMSVRCAIITAKGEAFSSGGNVKAMRNGEGMFGGTPVDMRRGYQTTIHGIPRSIYALEVPTICAVNGPAIGAGCDLTLMCDIRIAGRKAQFAESFLRVGLVSGDGGAWFLPRVVGLSRAYEMTLTGDVVDAERAERIGLVSKVVDDDMLMDEARALAARIAAHPPHSIRLNKRLLRESQGVSLDVALELASAMQALVQSTSDQKEAVAALIEKRKPSYKGK
ncbi:MAG TPA: crotonase/enoyl-CoA hydratase family protein [Hyphomicrobiaceae bacterium]|nr:crotonase/enoyl-CoA hydratase family protein [Hyphomicrobiaceae bacterium]